MKEKEVKEKIIEKKKKKKKEKVEKMKEFFNFNSKSIQFG